MKLDFESIGVWAKNNKSWLIMLGLFIALVLFVGYFLDACGRWRDWREIDKLNQNINAVQMNANAVNANLANLVIENRLATENANRLATEHNSAKNATDSARTQTNGTLANLANVQNGNFTNRSLSETEKARCRAYPNSKGCK